MKKYTKYKPSGVEWIGDIPEHWNLTSLKRITKFIYGNSLQSENREDGDIPVYGSNGIVGYHNQSITYSPCIIVGRKGSHGKVNYSEQSCFPIDTTYFIDKTATNNDLRWLFYALHTLNLDETSQDTGVPGLSREVAYAKMLQTPNHLSDQSSIARFLDHKTALIDRITNNRRKQIYLLKEERKAVINKAVTKGINKNAKMKPSGVEWLGEIPEHWDVVKLKHVASYKSGDTLSSEYIQETGEFPVYGGNNIRGFFNQFNHDGFFILIGRQGALCGNINYAKGKFWATEHAVVVYIKKHYETIWLGELLRIMNLNQYSQSAAQPGLAVEMIKNLSIALPPIEEQQAITSHIDQKTSKIDTLITKYEKQISLLEEYRTALISKAVTGQIDVREWQPKTELEFMP